jgi:Neuraminidase (sialidase)
MSAATAICARAADGPVHFNSLLPPGPGNPRNTEGDFIQLRDGRLMFAYTKFTGGGGDHDRAHIAARFSSDNGDTWTDSDTVVLENEGAMNVMSVSLLRLRDRRIGFFYLLKDSDTSCRPVLRYSRDEGKSWSAPVVCVKDPGYYVLNNDRAVQLKRGRLVLPVALHTRDGKWSGQGAAMCYFSDDQGKTWRRSKTVLESPKPSQSGLQEPGVVELRNGELLMFCRTSMGSQYFSRSKDGGDTWSTPEASELVSPVSPASIERIPSTGDLLAVWNDHSRVGEEFKAVDGKSSGKRTPLTVAISKDEGNTWIHRKNLLEDPEGWYCYTAIEFVKDRVLLAYVAGGSGLKRLSRTQIASFPVSYLYSS